LNGTAPLAYCAPRPAPKPSVGVAGGVALPFGPVSAPSPDTGSSTDQPNAQPSPDGETTDAPGSPQPAPTST
jgi:hypothetical protein